MQTDYETSKAKKTSWISIGQQSLQEDNGEDGAIIKTLESNFQNPKKVCMSWSKNMTMSLLKNTYNPWTIGYVYGTRRNEMGEATIIYNFKASPIPPCTSMIFLGQILLL